MWKCESEKVWKSESERKKEVKRVVKVYWVCCNEKVDHFIVYTKWYTLASTKVVCTQVYIWDIYEKNKRKL